MTEPRKFPHRVNPDGRYESICPDCLKTISSEHVEDRLLSAEQNHFCSLADLEQLWGLSRRIVSY
jgi:hypothetical protein